MNIRKTNYDMNSFSVYLLIVYHKDSLFKDKVGYVLKSRYAVICFHDVPFQIYLPFEIGRVRHQVESVPGIPFGKLHGKS